MCGIAGEFRFDGVAADWAAVARMTAASERRGPDRHGHYESGPVAFGHRRLAVIDLSPQADQPMVDTQRGLALVFNGAIYNYPELRGLLLAKGHSFKSHGDTEVILKAYGEWGVDCVQRFNGMFAFALWDAPRNCLFLARDRFGVKPLYYTLDAQRLRFASTLPALLAGGGIDTDIDPVGLHHQLTLHGVIPAPRTILRGVRKCRPAHTLLIQGTGSGTECRYWTLAARRPSGLYSEDEWIDGVHHALTQAVRRRKEIADVPVGVLLSGGLDSSLVLALLAEAGVPNLKTYTVGFEDHPDEKGSEFEYSDLVVERFGTEHHQFHVPTAQLLERLPEAVAAMAEPMVGQDAVAFYLLAERVSQEVNVVLSGQGADEVFGGYFWYPLMQAARGSDLVRFRQHYFDRGHEEWLDAIHPDYHLPDVTSALIEALLAEPGAEEFLDRVLRMDVTTLIVDDPVKRVDNMTMAWGLEARVPFLDHELVELAASMPPKLKLREGGKFPLKRIAQGLLPDSVIHRPKGYFPVPALKYVCGGVLEFTREIVASEACRRRGLVQEAYINTLLSHPERHLTPLQGSKLWHMALLELWLQLVVDAPPTAAINSRGPYEGLHQPLGCP